MVRPTTTIESTERLHIDFAKEAYRATNHKDEFSQMTKWLERREKILHHANFVTWRKEQQMKAAQKPTTPSIRWQPPDMACALHVKMTRHPSRKKAVPLEEIISDLHYGAQFFLPALARFVIQFTSPNLNSQQLEIQAANIQPIYLSAVHVYHRIKFWNPKVYGNLTLDSIHVQPTRLSKDGDVLAPARFDTALIRVQNTEQIPDKDGQCHRGLEGMPFALSTWS